MESTLPIESSLQPLDTASNWNIYHQFTRILYYLFLCTSLSPYLLACQAGILYFLLSHLLSISKLSINILKIYTYCSKKILKLILTSSQTSPLQFLFLCLILHTIIAHYFCPLVFLFLDLFF